MTEEVQYIIIIIYILLLDRYPTHIYILIIYSPSPVEICIVNMGQVHSIDT